MFIVFDNTDTFEVCDMRQNVVFNMGEVEERCTITFPIELYTRDTVDTLKQYFNVGDGRNYTIGLKDTADGEVNKELVFQGLVSIEWVAPENSKTGEPVFMACTRELIF